MLRAVSISLAVLLSSCDDGSFCHTPSEGWGRTDTICLSPAWLQEAAAAGQGRESAQEEDSTVNMVVRLDRTFRYSQLRLKVNNRRMLVPVDMRQGVGVCEATAPIALNPADTVLNITHLMWSDPLQGIISIGITPNY